MKVKITKSIDYTTPFSAAENDKDLEKITRLKYSKACSNLRTDAGFFARTIEGIKEHQTWRLIGYNTFEDFCKNELGRAIDEVEAIVIGVKALGGVATEAEAKQAAVWKLAADDHQNGMTQQEAAKKHGVTQQAVSKAKRNTTKNSQGEQKVVIPEWLKGNTAKALFRKLPKNLQDQAAKKEISVRGAAIKAGIIKVETPIEKAVKAFSKLEYDDMKIAIEEINTIWDNQ